MNTITPIPDRSVIKNFFSFDSFVTPRIIKILFWLTIAALSIMSLIEIGNGFGMMEYSVSAGFGAILLSIGKFIIGVILTKVTCELTLVLFKIAENTDREGAKE